MAIIIPSKNIYERSNDKVLDNKIKKIEVNATEILPNNEYSTSVYNESIQNLNTYVEDDQEVAYMGYTFTNSTIHNTPIISFALGQFLEPKYATISLKIPILQNNKYVSKVFDKSDDAGNPNIHCTIYGATKTQRIRASITNVKWANETNGIKKISSCEVYYDFTSTQDIESVSGAYTIPDKITAESSLNLDGKKAKITKSLEKNHNIDEAEIRLSDDKKYYTTKFTVICGVKEVYSTNGYILPNSFEPLQFEDDNINIREYIPEKIDITINGDTIGIDLTEKPFDYGESTNSKAIFSIENNELIQTSTEEGFDIPKIIANNTISQYANGKETAEIRCSISDYKNEDGSYAIRIPKNKNEINIEDILVTTDISNGTVVVNTLSPMFYDVKVTGTCANKIINGITLYTDFEVILKAGQYTATKKILQYPSSYEEMTLQNVKKELYGFRMQFQEGDIVIPYVLGANGIDKPMSLNKDNTPKAFEVISTEIYYDGAVWQNLVLQEYTSDFVDGDEVITDLTSTAWVFNDTLTAMPQTVFSVVFNPSGNSNISRPGLYWETTGNGDERGLWYARENQIDGTFSKGDSQIYSSTFGFWLDISAKQFTITGGTDATNTDLIEWLQANATML